MADSKLSNWSPMIGKFAFHLIGTNSGGMRYVALPLSRHPQCVLHIEGKNENPLSPSSEDGDDRESIKRRIDRFQISSWREAGTVPDKRWGRQTSSEMIASLLDQAGTAIPSVDKGRLPKPRSFNVIDYFVCRCLRVPTIVILRDGRTAIPAKVRNEKLSTQAAIARWKFSVYLMKRIVHFVERCHVVRIEDLMTAPDAHLGEICKFLGISNEPTMSQSLKTNEIQDTYRKSNPPPDELELRAKDEPWHAEIRAELELCGYI